MSTSFIKIDDVGLNYIDKIIIMTRSWRNQAASWKPVHMKNLQDLVKNNKEAEKLILSVGSIENFIMDRLFEPGIMYINEYFKIINFIVKNKLQKNVSL